MSSSFVVEPQEGGSKKEDTLILMVNDNGVISVDQDTLNGLIINQSDANVNVVRVGEVGNDATEGNLTLTVDPPAFVSSEGTTNSTHTNNNAATADSSGLVDPFMEMDLEQLERLETALQSEEAKKILGENVTAMLDMLSVEEQQNSIRHSIELDHCYTNRLSPSQPKPSDPLPDINSSDVDDSICLESKIPSSMILAVPSSVNMNELSVVTAKQKVIPTPPKIVKQPASLSSHTRRGSTAGQPLTAASKTTANINTRTQLNSVQDAKNQLKEDETGEELFSSSESSDSTESDNDSDFGSRSSRKDGSRRVRARGGRRGLTTRGGSMSASRRRGSNKHMDSDQVRLLDMEMAAAVSSMKSPEKDEKFDKSSPIKNKKTIKTMGGKKKDELATPPTPISEPPPVETNVLQTTNQVKANLISANMFKGDMILTKPGQSRNNQKVLLVQKPLTMSPNDNKNLNIKKQVMIPKHKLVTTPNSKGPIIKDNIRLSPPLILKTVVPTLDRTVVAHQNTVVPAKVQVEPVHQQKLVTPTTPTPNITKSKSVEMKKEKKKEDLPLETAVKATVEAHKSVESKTAAAPKKVVKKEHRKSDSHVVETLGPALFSTPDIIRRVSSSGELKAPESPTVVTSATPASTSSMINTTASSNIAVTTVPNMSSNTIMTCSNEKAEVEDEKSILDEPMVADFLMNESANTALAMKLEAQASMLAESLHHDKIDEKTTMADLLHPTLDMQPSLDTTSNTTTPQAMSSSVDQTKNANHVITESGMENDEHLLATLEMEAAKQLPNDEELLAEALLLQETLGVDLDHSALVDPTSEASEASEALLPPAIVDQATQALLTPPKPEYQAPPTPVTPAPSKPTLKSDSSSKKSSKEPVQIIRGGRVITLPPIEAPATRSKRLQAKAENQESKDEKKPLQLQQVQQQPPQPKSTSKLQNTQKQTKTEQAKIDKAIRNQSHVNLQKKDMIYGDVEDDYEDEPQSESEDDPNRLWCICRQPHNNRFMICCDICEDWFHGKCVNVTKAMGEQMEKQGIEWICPNCKKKKNEESKAKSNSRKQRSSTSEGKSNEHNRSLPSTSTATPSIVTNNSKPQPNSNSGKNPGPPSGATQCVVCKKEARKSSIYCSDACILAHAEVTSTKDKPQPIQPLKIVKSETPKIKPEGRIIVCDKKTGKILTGEDAPTASNLRTWLKEHPNYEVAKKNSLNTLQIAGKTVAAIQTPGFKISKQLQVKSQPGQAKMVFSKIPGSKQTVITTSLKKVDSPQSRPAGSPMQPINKTPTNKTTKTPTSHTKQTSIKTSLQHQYQSQTPMKPSATSTPKPVAKKPLETKPTTPQQSPNQVPKEQQQQPQQPQQQQGQSQQPQQPVKTPVSKKAEKDATRGSVKKMLTEALTNRLKDYPSSNLSEEEIKELAHQIELELYKYFKDTGTKYKAQSRRLVFNIKDPKNLTLIQKIADRSLSPDDLVKLSPEELASQELAEWREKETKHQLDMIKKNELDLMAQAKSIVVKTHKGEQIIESDGVDAANNTSVNELVTKLDANAVEDETTAGSGATTEHDHERHKQSRDRDRRRSRSRDRRKRSRERSKSKKHKRGSEHRRERKRKHSRSRHKEHRDHKRRRSGERAENASEQQSQPEDRLWRHIEDEPISAPAVHPSLDLAESDLSDREPSSTVTIHTPSDDQSTAAPVATVSETVWRGVVFMSEVARFEVTAHSVSGLSAEIMAELPSTFDVVGRIHPDTVWDYIGKMRKNANKEILVVKLQAINDEEFIPYITLYSYLSSRNRLGVLGNVSAKIKDFYIVPFSQGSQLPSVLLPLEPPACLGEQTHHLLLGIIVVHSSKKRPAGVSLAGPVSKVAKRDGTAERSISPSSQQLEESDVSSAPPLVHTQIRVTKLEVKQSLVITPSTEPEALPSPAPASEDDEPYSPGAPVELDLDAEPEDPNQLDRSSRSSRELQLKALDELERQIQEEKMQIQNISSTFLTDSSTLPGLGLDPPNSSYAEAYSPTDAGSFTPPPQGILEKVSNITIPENLPEILANVKRQESSKLDSYLPPKPGATFLTTVNSTAYQSEESYSPTYSKPSNSNRLSTEVQSSPKKETKSTLSTLSDLDLIKKADEELKALAAANAAATTATAPVTLFPTSIPPSYEPPPPGT